MKWFIAVKGMCELEETGNCWTSILHIFFGRAAAFWSVLQGSVFSVSVFQFLQLKTMGNYAYFIGCENQEFMVLYKQLLF